jgi:hypothetical protein
MDGIKISLGAFDLQPLRILFLFSATFLIVDPFLKQYKRPNVSQFSVKVVPNYEKYLFIYLILVIVSLFANANLFTNSELFVSITTVLSFIAVYFAVKRASNEGFINVIKHAIILVGIISSIIAILQFVVDQSFFRANSDFSRTAFGGFIRSTGVFGDDYIHAYMVISAIIWTYFTIPTSTKKYILLGLFITGVFFGFMRMGYVVTTFFFAHAILYASNASGKLKVLVVTLATIASIFLAFGVLSSGILESDIAQDRMMDEGTMELRFKLYKEGIETTFSDFSAILFGFGNESSQAYYDAIYRATDGHLGWATGETGGWHNLFIEILFFNGLPAAVLLFTFLIAMVKYFYYLTKLTDNHLYSIPFYLALCYLISNLTLGLGLEVSHAIVLGISAALMTGNRVQQVKQEVHAS